MYKIKNGFSLIELIVVISIVAILTAIAIPSYQRYMAKAKISAVMNATDGIKKAMINYYTKQGTFPHATQLGYQETSPGSDNLLNPEDINPAIQQLQVSYVGTTCSETVGFYSVMMDGSLLSLSANYAVAQAFFNQNGVIKTICTEADMNYESLGLYCSDPMDPNDYSNFIMNASSTVCN